MAESSEPSLLGLPAELRNKIWEMIVYHKPTDGVICPLQDTHGIGNRDCDASRVVVSGARFRIQDFEQAFGTRWEARFEQTYGTPGSEMRRSELIEVWENTAVAKSNHFCTLNCLLQPPVTLVNRQIRSEALPLFYYSNTFHFELDNFAETRNLLASPWRFADACDTLCKDGDQRRPMNWWRAIGASNLKNVSRLTLAGRSLFAGTGLLSAEYDRSKGTFRVA